MNVKIKKEDTIHLISEQMMAVTMTAVEDKRI